MASHPGAYGLSARHEPRAAVWSPAFPAFRVGRCYSAPSCRRNSAAFFPPTRAPPTNPPTQKIIDCFISFLGK